MKKCNKCKEIKDISYFVKNKSSKDGLNNYCKICKNKYNKSNIERIKENNKIYKAQNKIILNQLQKEYVKKNKDKIYLTRKIRYNKDSLFRLTENIRSNIGNSFLKNGYTKKSKTYEILGCSYKEFKLYLESKFESWMTWENKGRYNGEFNFGWDIDHIVPLSNAETEEDIIRLNHYTNLQPLCSKVNRDIKRDKLLHDYPK